MPDSSSVPRNVPTITKAAIQALPLAQYRGPIHVIAPGQSCMAACRALADEEVIGFDTETRPAFRKGEHYLPALVQLATRHAVYLFQINRHWFPMEIVGIMESAALIKSGLAVNQDLHKLKLIVAFREQNVIDLAVSAAQLGIKTTGLRSLAAMYLGARVSKRAQVTNWSRATLTPAQIQYAATDAWISRELYFKVFGK
ncbi:MAG: 3'-5' exonuclease domain-containing protein 2 [Verrucomicrobiales bacterium]|jgi:ribonuclease D|nr:3'-5' exonuclease domain-containing protein 2 [Verrucomicrobiales bacterium]